MSSYRLPVCEENEHAGVDPEESHVDIKGQQHTKCKEKLSSLALFNPQKKKKKSRGET